jgi:basic amino acid/polyamine antiporter, APA family
VREGSTTQLVTSALKALAFGILITACFLATRPIPVPIPVSHAVTAAGIVVALQAMVYTYDGWAGVLYFSGEMKQPGRDIPRSMFTGVVSVLIIYLLVNAAFVRLIPLHEMAGDPLVADSASKIVFGSAGTGVIRILIAVSLLSAINASMLMASRTMYAVGVSRVNVGGTPTTALAFTTIVAIAFAMSGTFNQIIAMAAFFFVANYTASFASVFRLRQREPQGERPYRAWGYPFTTALVLIGSLAFLLAVIVTDPRNSAYAVLLLAISYPAYRLMKRKIGQ